jgi:O-methyltransferase
MAMSSIEGFVQNAFRRLGLEVRRSRRSDHEYSQIFPQATYSPWNTDTAFRSVYREVERNTLVDIYRCYELWSLTRELAHVPGALIEVGVWRGGSGAVIAKAASLAGIMDPVYLCDTFVGVPKAGSRDPRYRGGEHADTSPAIVAALMSRLGIGNVKIVPGVFPEESEGIDAQTFRLAHIDVDVYRSARDCLCHLWPRMSIGGVVVFDDYGFDGLRGVRECVDELRGGAGCLFVYNLNGHGLLVKVDSQELPFVR